jgi:hypothetical protein
MAREGAAPYDMQIKLLMIGDSGKVRNMSSLSIVIPRFFVARRRSADVKSAEAPRTTLLSFTRSSRG